MTRARPMHADECYTDVRLVRRLLAGQFPRWADLPLEPVQSAGTDNALYRLGSGMVVRLPRIRSAVERLEKELAWLPRLASKLPCAVPAPLAKGAPAEGYPWTWAVYRWLYGGNPSVGGLADSRALAVELAAFATALRRIDATGGPSASRGVPLTARDGPTRAAIDALAGVVETDAVTAAWEVALQVPAWRGSPAWIHGDLSPGNLLCTNGRLSAVIDFGCMGTDDPACDGIPAWNLLPADVRDEFRLALQVDDATWLRARGWALWIALIQLPYYSSTNPTLATNARHVIAEVLADHRRAA